MTDEQRRQRNSLIIAGFACLSVLALAFIIFAMLGMPGSPITKAISAPLLLGAVGAFAGAAKVGRNSGSGGHHPDQAGGPPRVSAGGAQDFAPPPPNRAGVPPMPPGSPSPVQPSRPPQGPFQGPPMGPPQGPPMGPHPGQGPMGPMPPHRPPPSGNRTGLIIAVTAVIVLAVIGGGAGLWWWTSHNSGHNVAGNEPPLEDPGGTGQPTTGPTTPNQKSEEELVNVLPEICERVALPVQAKGTTPDHDTEDSDRAECEWEITTTAEARSLDIEVEAFPTVAEARDKFKDDLAYARNPEKNGGFHRNPQPLDQIGDQAFEAQSYDIIRDRPGEKAQGHYDVGGAVVISRVDNVVIRVNWLGADYPAGAAGGKTLHGERFAYSNTRVETIQLARQVVDLVEDA